MSEFLKSNLNKMNIFIGSLFAWSLNGFNKPAAPKSSGVCNCKIVSVTKNLNLCKLSLTVTEKTV
jgi:hypothetical protein